VSILSGPVESALPVFTATKKPAIGWMTGQIVPRGNAADANGAQAARLSTGRHQFSLFALAFLAKSRFMAAR
jgi:hypothetical protein